MYVLNLYQNTKVVLYTLKTYLNYFQNLLHNTINQSNTIQCMSKIYSKPYTNFQNLLQLLQNLYTNSQCLY